MLEFAAKNKLEKFLGHLAVTRGLIWIALISYFYHFDEIHENQGWIAFACTNYVIFTIYAYEKFMEGMKFVSHLMKFANL